MGEDVEVRRRFIEEYRSGCEKPRRLEYPAFPPSFRIPIPAPTTVYNDPLCKMAHLLSYDWQGK